jgi:hypothetical protein
MKNMLRSKIIKAEVQAKFQDGRRRHIGNSSECYKGGNCHPILMKLSEQTKKRMRSSEVTETGSQVKFQDGRCRQFGK